MLFFASERSNQAKQLLEALQHLVGGTQNRSAGLAIFEASFHRYAESEVEVLIPALLNQKNYLTKQKPAHEYHEIVNLMRIESLLTRFKYNFPTIFRHYENAFEKYAYDVNKEYKEEYNEKSENKIRKKFLPLQPR